MISFADNQLKVFASALACPREPKYVHPTLTGLVPKLVIGKDSDSRDALYYLKDELEPLLAIGYTRSDATAEVINRCSSLMMRFDDVEYNNMRVSLLYPLLSRTMSSHAIHLA